MEAQECRLGKKGVRENINNSGGGRTQSGGKKACLPQRALLSPLSLSVCMPDRRRKREETLPPILTMSSAPKKEGGKGGQKPLSLPFCALSGEREEEEREEESRRKHENVITAASIYQ